MTSRNCNQDIYNEFWLVIIHIPDIYKCIWDIFKKIKLEISLIVFWLVKSYLKISAIGITTSQNSFEDISNWITTSQIVIGDISNCILTRQIVFKDILNWNYD